MTRTKFFSAIVVALVALPIPVDAATKVKSVPLKIMPATPVTFSNLTGGTGDQVSAIALSPSAIILAGTVESSSATSAWITSQSLGGTDGFIAGLDATGKRLWDTRLGGAQDDVATAMIGDKQGNFWVVGSSQSPNPPSVATPSATPAAAPTPAPTINPDGVKVLPVKPPSAPLSRLMIWEINSTGQIISTKYFENSGPIFPRSIAAQGSGFIISGRTIIGNNLQSFTISFDGSNFGAPALFSQIYSQIAFNRTFKLTNGSIKSFISLGPIPEIPTWKSKAAIPVVIQYSKLKTVIAASYLHGSVIDMQYQRNLGVVAVTSQAGGYGLYVIPVKN